MGMRLRPIVVAFLAGRLVSHTVWISLAHVVSAPFRRLVTEHLQRAGPLVLELLALATLVAFTRIDWPRVCGLMLATVGTDKQQCRGLKHGTQALHSAPIRLPPCRP